jgi:hypothetical protein
MRYVNASVLRACFKAFLGEQEYRKFLEAGSAEPLKYWQEKAWEKFVSTHPEMNVTSTERREALDVCPTHEKPLITGFTDSPAGFYFGNPRERRQDFPMAPHMPLVTAGVCWVKYCQDCVAAQAAHFARGKDQRGSVK